MKPRKVKSTMLNLVFKLFNLVYRYFKIFVLLALIKVV